MVEKKKASDVSGLGVLSLYVIEGTIVAIAVTRGAALVGPGLMAGAGGVAAVMLVLWATGWPTFVRVKEIERDAAQRAAHPGSTFKGRMPPRGAAGALFGIGRVSVGVLFAAHHAIYEKLSIVFRPPLAVVWLVVGGALVMFLPTRAPPEQKLPTAVVDDKPLVEQVVDRYACPVGAEKVGAPPPEGHELYCDRAGTKHGPYRKWYDDAGERLALEGNYVDGDRDGVWKAWYSSGRQKNEGTFKKGTPDGHHLGWNEEGKKILDVTYEDGKEVRK